MKPADDGPKIRVIDLRGMVFNESPEAEQMFERGLKRLITQAKDHYVTLVLDCRTLPQVAFLAGAIVSEVRKNFSFWAMGYLPGLTPLQPTVGLETRLLLVDGNAATIIKQIRTAMPCCQPDKAW